MPLSSQQPPVATNAHSQPQSDQAVSQEAEYLRQRKLLTMVPFSRTTLWRRIKDRTFPQPFKISKGITVWRAEDIRTWIRHQAAP